MSSTAAIGPLTGSPSEPRIDRETYRRLAVRAKWLSWLSLAVVTAEGVVAIVAGLVASSVALIAFGLDSVVEGFASLVIVWRFTGSRMFSQAAETRAQKLVAIQFFVLAPYVGFEATRALVGGERPDESWVGIGLATASLISMPMLGIAKQRIADQIGSAATKGEGRQNMICAYMAGALLVGLLGNALIGAWWLDPAVGLLIAGLAVKEGVDAWRGDGCCVADPLAGAFSERRPKRSAAPMAELTLAAYGLYLALAFGLRTIVQIKRTGESGFKGLNGRIGSGEWTAGVLFTVALIVGALAPVLDLTGTVEPIAALDTTAAHAGGIPLFAVGLGARSRPSSPWGRPGGSASTSPNARNW